MSDYTISIYQRLTDNLINHSSKSHNVITMINNFTEMRQTIAYIKKLDISNFEHVYNVIGFIVFIEKVMLYDSSICDKYTENTKTKLSADYIPKKNEKALIIDYVDKHGSLLISLFPPLGSDDGSKVKATITQRNPKHAHHDTREVDIIQGALSEQEKIFIKSINKIIRKEVLALFKEYYKKIKDLT